MKRDNKRTLLRTIALWLITSLVFVLYLVLAKENHFLQLEPMLDGSAARPFVYRVLPILVIKLLTALSTISPNLVAILVMYASLLGFAFSLSTLLDIFIPKPLSKVLALLGPIGLIPLLIDQRHVYDLPILFLVTLALVLLAKRRFDLYTVVFLLAALTKETSLFLIFFFLLHFRDLDRKKFLALAGIQLGLYAAVRICLMIFFRDNPGSVAEFHLIEHFKTYLQQPLNTLLLVGTLTLIILVLVRIKEPTNFIRHSLAAIGFPTLVLYLFFGVPFEIRVFLETYPSVFLLFGFWFSTIRSKITFSKAKEKIAP